MSLSEKMASGNESMLFKEEVLTFIITKDKSEQSVDECSHIIVQRIEGEKYEIVVLNQTRKVRSINGSNFQVMVRVMVSVDHH